VKQASLDITPQGRLHNGGMVRDAPWRKLGGFFDDNDAFAGVYNNLLLHVYIYHFTPVHFYLAVCPFFYIIYQLSLHANSA